MTTHSASQGSVVHLFDRAEQEGRDVVVYFKPHVAQRFEVRVSETEAQRDRGDRLRVIGRGDSLAEAALRANDEWRLRYG